MYVFAGGIWRRRRNDNRPKSDCRRISNRRRIGCIFDFCRTRFRDKALDMSTTLFALIRHSQLFVDYAPVRDVTFRRGRPISIFEKCPPHELSFLSRNTVCLTRGKRTSFRSFRVRICPCPVRTRFWAVRPFTFIQNENQWTIAVDAKIPADEEECSPTT